MARDPSPWQLFHLLRNVGEQLDSSLPKSYTHTLRTKYGTFQANSLLGIVWEVFKYHLKRLAGYRIW